MPAALEAVDLAALCAEALAWALLTVLVVLLAKLVAVLGTEVDFGLFTIRPLGWLADALSSYVLAGAEDARRAVAGAMQATWDGLAWGIEATMTIFTDLATKARDAIVHLWQHTVQPWVHALTDPIRRLAAKAEAEVASLAAKEARDIARTTAELKQFGWDRLQNAEDFTRREVAAARADAAAATAAVSGYLHAAEAGAEALPGTVGTDFGSLWDALRQNIRPQDLEQLLAAGLLSGMLVRVLTQEAGLADEDCRAKHKQICGVDPSQWTKLLEALALVGAAVDFRELVDFASGLVKEAGDLIVTVE